MNRIASIAFLSLLAAATVATALTSGPLRPVAPPAYPPSCLSAPLTDTPTGPSVTRSVQLQAVDRNTGEGRGIETVNFTFWRVPCEGGKSALLLRISRAVASSSTVVVLYPGYGLDATQGGAFGTVRLSQEPNTLISALQPKARLASDLTLVIENVAQDDAYSTILVPAALPAGVTARKFDFNQAIDITVFPQTSSVDLNPLPTPIVASIPAYDRTQYPSASLPMPITGYNVGNYYDPAHNGEGVIVEVGDVADPPVPRLRFVDVAWYTYDNSGNPFWIFGTARTEPGLFVVQVPMVYLSGGGFAGSFGSSATQHPWGTFAITFPDCSSMEFTYAANAGLPASIPSGAGTRTWTRLTQENGLACR
jgi:hypothetical protein